MTRSAFAALICLLFIVPISVAQGSPSGLDLPVMDPTKTPDPNDPPKPPGWDDGIELGPIAFDGIFDPRDIPPPIFFGEEIKMESDTLVYVVDRSGSMQAWSMRNRENRLLLAKQETNGSIEHLAQSIKFNIIFFDCSLRTWQPEPVPATYENKQAAMAWVNGQELGGGTGTAPAIVAALLFKPGVIILLTDGGPNCPVQSSGGQPAWNEEHLRIIRTENTEGAPIHVFGIDAYWIFRDFCRAVASQSGGNYYER